MIEQAVEQTYGRCLVGPKGEVRWCRPYQEHYEVAVEVIEEEGDAEQGYCASTVLEGRGWVRITSEGGITTPNFYPVRHFTQAQRDVIFDMAMAAQAADQEYTARNLMNKLMEVD